MIIKREQASQLQLNQPERVGSSSSSSTMPSDSAGYIDPWSMEEEEINSIQERSLTDRRRSYRRVEEKDLITKAYEEANAIRENAYQEGFQEGLQKVDSVIQDLKETIDTLLNAREQALIAAGNDIAKIAVEIAERIIKTEVACDDALVLGIIRDTVQKAGRQNKSILIKVHPDDVRQVKETMKEEPFLNPNTTEVVVMEDPAVDQGSCMVETNNGLIDASFSTQLEVLKRIFNGGSR